MISYTRYMGSASEGRGEIIYYKFIKDKSNLNRMKFLPEHNRTEALRLFKIRYCTFKPEALRLYSKGIVPINIM